jgi:dihydroneopterin aldolase
MEKTKESLIAIEGMTFFAHHGVFPFERQQGASFVVDLYIYCDISRSSDTDQLQDTIDYMAVYQLTAKEMELPSNLLEHVCQRIGTRIKSAFSGINRLKVCISKPAAPIGGEIKRVYIESEF